MRTRGPTGNGAARRLVGNGGLSSLAVGPFAAIVLPPSVS